MSEHREWALQRDNGILFNGIWLGRGGTDCRFVSADFDSAKMATAEHNATVRAYRDAMAELERIGKINDSMCDTIAELEACPMPEYDRSLFTDGDDIRTEEIRGVEDVALMLERASDEELVKLYESVRDSKERRDGFPLEHAVRAVRARVEAPLLAEIRHLRNKLASAHQKTERQAAELTKLYHLRQGDAGERRGLQSERDTLNARLSETAAKAWELDVTYIEARKAWGLACGTEDGVRAILDLCRSRIRPTFECGECAKNKSERDVMYRDWDDCRNRMLAVRLALNEGSES